MRRETLQNFNVPPSAIVHAVRFTRNSNAQNGFCTIQAMDALIHHATAGYSRSHFRRVWEKWTEVDKQCCSLS